MENLYREHDATDVQNDDAKWEEQVVAGPAEDNIFIQEFLDSKLTTSEPVKEEATEPTVELPKPSPRYGHAACKYQGLSISSLFTDKNKFYKRHDFMTTN